MKAPYIPENAPFSDDQRKWLGGFFAGLNSRLLASQTATGAAESSSNLLTILYGTQTGNAETLASEAAQSAAAHGLKAQVKGMDEIAVESLQDCERLLIITSTYGEGEMPDNAQALWESINAESFSLEKVNFAVLGLGDTSYDLFCQAAKDWERRLEELGAKKLTERVDCDLDYEEPFAEWLEQALPAMAKVNGGVGAVDPAAVASAPTAPRWSKKSPFPARLLKKQVLTKNASTKETCHYEISLGDSEITYEVGDALGVIPTNCPELVGAIIAALGCKPEDIVPGASGADISLGDALRDDFEIKLPSKELIAAVAERSGDPQLNQLIHANKPDELKSFMWGVDTLDLLLMYPKAAFDAKEFVTLLKRIQPRLYSISSSINKHPGEVHLTVASVRYETHGRAKKGVASTFLADRVDEDTDVLIYAAPNKNFGVPPSDEAPMIMVGPGTGIAPFRAFLEERDVRGAKGKNWLFFGDRNRASDFFYEAELTDLQNRGVLTRLDLAFSRDQKEKIYVQDRMREHGAELYQWLEEGGYFFVCGDAYRMAKDVDQALHDVIAEHGDLSADEAVKYVNELKKAKRYVRDVY
ncbi:sulfite reductase subunit alpha [Cerasicoccus frondis]|uniref:sulfite reductase subunit alpha n=1 Tax=Cerasicoccus frondis TaxID=490090 RepID=UPI0028524C27|nr:sulfite reductase subunit alpha [Cerasicoccus frondis]